MVDTFLDALLVIVYLGFIFQAIMMVLASFIYFITKPSEDRNG